MKENFITRTIKRLLFGEKDEFGGRKKRISINFGYIKAGVVMLTLLGVATFINMSSYDMNIDCTKATDTCTISKVLPFESRPIAISRFNTSRIVDVYTEARELDDKSVIYDILLNYGPYEGKMFIDYGFNSVIKANTVKMKLVKYINGPAETLSITKRCYFNNYFCF